MNGLLVTINIRENILYYHQFLPNIPLFSLTHYNSVGVNYVFPIPYIAASLPELMNTFEKKVGPDTACQLLAL